MIDEKFEERKDAYTDGKNEGKIRVVENRKDDLEIDLPQLYLDFMKLNNIWIGTIESKVKAKEFRDMLNEIDHLDFRLC